MIKVSGIGSALGANSTPQIGQGQAIDLACLLALAGIEESTGFTGVYCEELNKLAVTAIEQNVSDPLLWQQINQAVLGFLADKPPYKKLASKGSLGNPLHGDFEGHELLGCLLQPVSPDDQVIFSGVKIYLVEALLSGRITGRYRDSTPKDIRKAADTGCEDRLRLLRRLPRVDRPNFDLNLTKTVQELAEHENLKPVERTYLRAMGRLVGLKLLGDRHSSRQAPSRKPSSMKKIAAKSRVITRVRPSYWPCEEGEESALPSSIYEIVEPPEEDQEASGEPSDTGVLFQEILDREALGFDVDANHKRRQSNYWFEQASLVSPYNRGLLIKPERRQLCRCVRGGLVDSDEHTRFIAGLVALSYLTSLTIDQLLADLHGNRLDASGTYIRTILQPESAFVPAEEVCDRWTPPIAECSLPLPSELYDWLKCYTSPRGSIQTPDSLQSEHQIKKRFASFLHGARAGDRFELTQSRIANALKRQLGTDSMGPLGVYLLTGSKDERPPVLIHYAGIDVVQLKSLYKLALESIWI